MALFWNMLNIVMRLARSLVRGREGARQRAHVDSRASDPPVAVLDIDVFDELRVALGNDTNRVRGVYVKFLESTVKRIDELRHQPVAASLKTLHALKGSAGMVGASRLAVLAARLHEEAADQGTLSRAIADIESELARFRGALNVQLAQPK